MKIINLVSLIAIAISVQVNADTSKKEWCDGMQEEREIYLKYPDQADYAPPTSNVQLSLIHI